MVWMSLVRIKSQTFPKNGVYALMDLRRAEGTRYIKNYSDITFPIKEVLSSKKTSKWAEAA